MKIQFRSVLCVSLSCLFSPTAVLATGSIYLEPGRSGVPGSWLTSEFSRQWGLGAINAQYAYARGYNGQGVSIGVLDAKLFPHPEFAGKLTLVSDALPYDFDTDKESGIIAFEGHGLHVAGIAAAGREGTGMHGVAFGATLATGSISDTDSPLEFMTQSNVRVINNSWGDDVPIEKDAAGNDVSLPNGTWKYELLTRASQIDALAPLRERIDAFSQRPIPTTIADENMDIAGYAGMLRAARHSKLIVFAAGNENNYNVPAKDASLPYLFPEVLDRYLTVTNLTPNDDLDVSSTSCGHTASYCVSAPGTDIYSAVGRFVSRTGALITEAALNRGELSVEPGYEEMTGSSMAAPHVTGAVAVLMQRFPYMTAEQISTVLKTTATDLGAPGIDARFGWGKINLREAIDGPKTLIAPADIPAEFYVPGSYTNTQFVANIPGIGALLDVGTPLERQCTGPECAWDVWRNDIAGHGGLTKEGAGTLVMAGANTYSGPTWVNQGRLAINGSVTSNVSVQSGGTVGGSGTVSSLTARGGGTVAPGNSIGTLNVAGNVSFEPGSVYAVEVAANGRSDQIQSSGVATLNGGVVNVSLENSPNLLSASEARSLLGQQFNILSASQGINGQFAAFAPNYPFIGTQLNYQPNQLTLAIARNQTTFASVAQTRNERAVATEAETLGAGSPVYESLLASDSAAQARDAFKQLSGQLHSDVAAAQMADSRYIRDAVNGRLQQAQALDSSVQIDTHDNGGWVQLLGGRNNVSGDNNASGYSSSTSGVLLGLDTEVSDGWWVGAATGYTQSHLNGQSASADSDNYHLSIYGGKRFEAIALRLGGATTWHRLDTSRRVAYANQSDYGKADYNARTDQVFAEIGYTQWNLLEPFANLTYLNYQSDSFKEKGGAAALHASKQSQDATLSTLGLRAHTQLPISSTSAVTLRGELGWEHQFGDTDRKASLKFTGSDTAFAVNSVPVARDGAVIKASAEMALTKDTLVSLNYSGLLSNRGNNNGINAGFTFRF